jgi:hypothetical protein
MATMRERKPFKAFRSLFTKHIRFECYVSLTYIFSISEIAFLSIKIPRVVFEPIVFRFFFLLCIYIYILIYTTSDTINQVVFIML